MLKLFNSLLPLFFRQYIWHKKIHDKTIFLTFDDGPIPFVTEWVLDILKKYNIKATFFCIGDNIQKHPEVFKRIIQENHQIGNHTFHHLNGWKTDVEFYIENSILCQKEINKYTSITSNLFRPPYGKIKKSQSKALKRIGYEIVMWSVITKDYDNYTSPERCLKNALYNLQPGNIIVFHDSIKAQENLFYALPRFIEDAIAKGYSFSTL